MKLTNLFNSFEQQKIVINQPKSDKIIKKSDYVREKIARRAALEFKTGMYGEDYKMSLKFIKIGLISDKLQLIQGWVCLFKVNFIDLL